MVTYKQKSDWSVKSVVVTTLVTALMVGLGLWFYYGSHEVVAAYLLWGLYIAMCFSSLFFMPLETQVDKDKLVIMFSCRFKEIPLSEIKKVEPYRVTMNFVRIFGSGAFFGWWGWFRNKGLGRFMVYAGNLEHVIYVELFNGKKYVVSCKNPQDMTDAIVKQKIN